YSSLSSGFARAVSNCEISAPETNALSPAPASTTTRIAGSASNAESTFGIPAHISTETALRRSGLLKISQPIAPSLRPTSFSVPLSTAPAFGKVSINSLIPILRIQIRSRRLDHTIGAHFVDFTGAIAQFRKHVLGIDAR